LDERPFVVGCGIGWEDRDGRDITDVLLNTDNLEGRGPDAAAVGDGAEIAVGGGVGEGEEGAVGLNAIVRRGAGGADGEGVDAASVAASDDEGADRAGNWHAGDEDGALRLAGVADDAVGATSGVASERDPPLGDESDGVVGATDAGLRDEALVVPRKEGAVVVDVVIADGVIFQVAADDGGGADTL